MTALLIIDTQNDFFEGGAMPIVNSLSIIPKINRLRTNFDVVIFSKDWHPENHCSFKGSGGNRTPHCLQGTNGANIHAGIDVKETDYIIPKGTKQLHDSNSAFYNSKHGNEQTNLDNILTKNNIKTLYICGLAIDCCVYSTILDAIKMRYKCVYIKDASAGINGDAIKRCEKHLKLIGVSIVDSTDI